MDSTIKYDPSTQRFSPNADFKREGLNSICMLVPLILEIFMKKNTHFPYTVLVEVKKKFKHVLP